MYWDIVRYASLMLFAGMMADNLRVLLCMPTDMESEPKRTVTMCTATTST